MMLYVAVDIGCLECGEESAVIGIYLDEEVANQEAEKAMDMDTGIPGQHHYQVFPVDGITVEGSVNNNGDSDVSEPGRDRGSYIPAVRSR